MFDTWTIALLKIWGSVLTLSPPNKLSSATFYICFNFQTVSILLKVGENDVCVSNSLDPGETASYSLSHPDIKVVCICGLRVNVLLRQH